MTDYGVYDFSKEKVKAVIVTTYHSGTVCTVGENTSFLNFAKRCLEQGIEVVLAPIDKNANLYESAVGLEECAILSYNQSVGITVVKVMLAISQGKEIRYCLDCDFACEKV